MPSIFRYVLFITEPQKPVLLSKLTRNDPDLLRYVSAAYKTLDLSEEDWKKAEENYKVHLLYQDMLNKRAEVEKLAASGKQKYEYDSDEDTEGGTWEHKLRDKVINYLNSNMVTISSVAIKFQESCYNLGTGNTAKMYVWKQDLPLVPFEV